MLPKNPWFLKCRLPEFHEDLQVDQYFPQGFDIGDTEAEGTNIVLVAVDPTNNAYFSVRKGSISEQKSKKSLTNVSFRSPDRLDRNLHRGRVKVKNFYCLVFSSL